jgi:hypothetical protein
MSQRWSTFSDQWRIISVQKRILCLATDNNKKYTKNFNRGEKKMPIYPKLILKLVEESGVGFSNAKTNEEIKIKISQYGYDDARLDELLALNARTVEKLQAFESLSGQQLDATSKLDEKYQSEYNQYSVFRQIANKVFVGEEYKGLRSQLGIDVDIKTNFEGVIEQAKQFYEAAMKNQDRLEGILKISLTSEKIQERLNAFSVLKNLNDAQESAKGKAKAARKERDESYLELRKAWENFKIVCRHLFKDNDEYLKILNIKPKKKKTIKKENEEDQEANEEQ